MKTVDLCNAIGCKQFPGMVIDHFRVEEDNHKVACFIINYTDPVLGVYITFAGEVNNRTVDWKVYSLPGYEDKAMDHIDTLLLYINNQIGRYDFYTERNVEFLNY